MQSKARSSDRLLNREVKPVSFIYANRVVGGTRRRLQPAKVIVTKTNSGTTANIIIFSIGRASRAMQNPLPRHKATLRWKPPGPPLVVPRVRNVQPSRIISTVVVTSAITIISVTMSSSRTVNEPLQPPILPPKARGPNRTLTRIAFSALNPPSVGTLEAFRKHSFSFRISAISSVPTSRLRLTQFRF